MFLMKFFPFALPAILVGIVGALQQSSPTIHSFAEPIDAISVRLSSEKAVAIRGRADDHWTAWQELHNENEQDPTLRESNLVMFPNPVSDIQIRGDIRDDALHPIRVSKDPARYQVAALTNPGTPRILSRSDWGADDSILYKNAGSSVPTRDPNSVESNDTSGTQPELTQRQKDCNAAVANYPQEFKTVNHQTQNSRDQIYRWARDYSPKVKLLVVHHTAIENEGDSRAGIEKMRALYTYHANNRGWGDIGYNYVIDADGRIYEGKSGGPYVVGGHAYCNNVGTMGIAMLGNFDEENPSQSQVHSLQWLLSHLATMYDIDLTQQVKFHGTKLSPIVGHRDLLSTDCPGYFMFGALAQVRSNVIAGNLIADVRFPAPLKQIASTKTFVDQSKARKQQRVADLPTAMRKPMVQTGVTPMGSDEISGRPGDEVVFTVRYIGGDTPEAKRSAIADIFASDPTLTLREELNGNYVTVRDQLLLPDTLPAHGSVQIRLKAQLPFDAGTSILQIGQTTYNVTASGRRQLGARGKEVIPQSVTRANLTRSRTSPVARTVRSTAQRTYTPSSVSSVSSDSSVSSSPVLRLFLTSENRIVTLDLEEYLLGLGEEPDTEPYEKQRAFAIAARTYAAYYMDPDHRKFPGQEYDATDSPATFQKYSGPTFTKNNPNWVRAVLDTKGQVLMKNNVLIRPPYFSSDDGRTRTPVEAGWGKTFPFAEIYASKEDPWCTGLPLNGHGVGMSGCGAKGQALEGKTGEEILQYYYPTTVIQAF
jgi:hypothetical protein